MTPLTDVRVTLSAPCPDCSSISCFLVSQSAMAEITTQHVNDHTRLRTPVFIRIPFVNHARHVGVIFWHSDYIKANAFITFISVSSLF
jgi:hypothetical protein